MAGETILTIIGNLTADPELRTLSDGNPVASFTIASTPRTYNRQTQQYEDGTALFLRCSAWNDLARHISQSCSKGMRVVAQGRLSQHSYQAHDGSNRTVMELTVDEIGPSRAGHETGRPQRLSGRRHLRQPERPAPAAPAADDTAAGVRPVGQRRQRPHAGHVRHRCRRTGILERTPSWQRKRTRDLFRTRSYPTR